jgi:hypothetical protein
MRWRRLQLAAIFPSSGFSALRTIFAVHPTIPECIESLSGICIWNLRAFAEELIVISGGIRYEDSLDEYSCQRFDGWHGQCAGYGSAEFARLAAAGYDASAVPKSADATDDSGGSGAASNTTAERVPCIASWRTHSYRSGQHYSRRFDEDHRRQESQDRRRNRGESHSGYENYERQRAGA